MNLENSGVVVMGSPLASFVSFELVFSESDYFISVNGGLVLSECGGFSVDENDCFVFHCEDGVFVSFPMSEMVLGLIAQSEKVLFVRFVGGDIEEACELVKENNHG